MEWHLVSALLVSAIVLSVLLLVSLNQFLCFERSQPVPRDVRQRNKRRAREEDQEKSERFTVYSIALIAKLPYASCIEWCSFVGRAVELIQELVKREGKYEFVRELHNIGMFVKLVLCS